MGSRETRPGPRKDHPARNVQPKQHDTYARRSKRSKALVCDGCGVVYHGGKWYWGAPPLTDVDGGLCPACERVRDRYPAGEIRIHPGLLAFRDEILNLISNVEELEKAEHPLERLMDVQDSEDGILVTTTGLHLARRVAGKLKRRFGSKVSIRYPEEQNLIFVDLSDH